MLLPRIAAAFRGGDDHILTSGVRLIEEQGFRVLGAHEVAPEILVPEGTLGRSHPSERDRADIALGLDYLRATGPFDVGQAVVVSGKHVQAVEAADPKKLIADYTSAKRAFYASLHQPRFLKGWLNRCNDVQANALTIIGEQDAS